MLVQIGDDWDLSDLQAYFIASGDDESVPISVLNNFKFPGGNDEFGKMTLSHFSPYIIFDELIHSDKPVLTPTPNSDSGEPNRSDSAPPVTGDLSIELLISSLAIVLVFALGIMLRMLKSKRKFEE